MVFTYISFTYLSTLRTKKRIIPNCHHKVNSLYIRIRLVSKTTLLLGPFRQTNKKTTNSAGNTRGFCYQGKQISKAKLQPNETQSLIIGHFRKGNQFLKKSIFVLDHYFWGAGKTSLIYNTLENLITKPITTQHNLYSKKKVKRKSIVTIVC